MKFLEVRVLLNLHQYEQNNQLSANGIIDLIFSGTTSLSIKVTDSIEQVSLLLSFSNLSLSYVRKSKQQNLSKMQETHPLLSANLHLILNNLKLNLIFQL